MPRGEGRKRKGTIKSLKYEYNPLDRTDARKLNRALLREPLKDFRAELRQLNYTNEHLPIRPRGRDLPHVHPEPSEPAKNIDIHSPTTGHGLRHLALIASQEVFKINHEIIQKQMMDSFGDKVQGSYDKGQMTEDRREFMVV